MTARNFGVTSGATVGDNQPRRSHYARRTPRGSILVSDPPFERGKVTQALFDCLAVLGAFLFVSITGLGIAFAVLCLLFVGF